MAAAHADIMASLYFTTSSCGAANYIAAHKAGVVGTKLAAHLVDIGSHKVLSGPQKGSDFYAINPKGNVPTVVLEDGTILNENAATLQYIADLNPDAMLAPPSGTSARYLLQSKLSYLSSELHASCGPLFNPSLDPTVKEFVVKKLHTKYKYVNDVELAGGKQYLVGDSFTVADSYCYIILTWAGYLGQDISQYSTLKAYFDNIASLSFVQEAHAKMKELMDANA